MGLKCDFLGLIAVFSSCHANWQVYRAIELLKCLPIAIGAECRSDTVSVMVVLKDPKSLATIQCALAIPMRRQAGLWSDS